MLTALTFSIVLLLNGAASQYWFAAMADASKLRVAGKYAEAEERYRDAVREAAKEEPPMPTHSAAKPTRRSHRWKRPCNTMTVG